MPAIDGLRAFAVFGVLILHFGWLPVGRAGLLEKLHLNSVFQYGWVGVDLFFVISGFLITGILLDSKQSPQYFRNFYARRALRIWPLYYAVLLFVFVIYPAIHPSGSLVHRSGWIYYLFYVQNFMNLDSIPLLGVTWTLAIEEQFYITWPLVVFLFDRKTLRRIVVTLLIASPLIRLALNPFIGYRYASLTFGRMDGILAGSLLALWFRSDSFSMARLRKLAPALLLVGSAGSAVLLTTSDHAGQQSILVYSFLAMAFSGLLCFGAVDSILPRPFRALLKCPPVRYVGKISYGIYLLHPIAYVAFNLVVHAWHLPVENNTVGQDIFCLVAEVGLAIMVATLSWCLFEQPILRLKKRFERTSPTPSAAPTATFAKLPVQGSTA